MMRVLMNAASAHMGGAVTYLQNVLRWLPDVAPDDDFIVYVPEGTRTKLPVALANVELRAYPHASTQGAVRLLFDQVEVPRLVRQEKVDVLFSSTGFGTFLSPCAEVLLVRNMAYFDPEFQRKYRELRRSLRKNTQRRWHSLLSIRCADRVLFPTNAMRETVRDYARLNESDVRVIHYGYDDRGTDDGRRLHGDLRHRIRTWKENGEALLLNVSTYAVHKNFETVIGALALLRDRGVKARLLTTTSREQTTDTAEYDALQQRAEELDVRGQWYELGYVPYEQLRDLYSLVDAYLFPSFTESFGHSLVEAMAEGLPVIASATPVNMEVCDDAGVYFRTFDASDCAATIEHVLGDASLRRDMAVRSTRRSASFSWQTYTQSLVCIFREACSRRPRPARTAPVFVSGD